VFPANTRVMLDLHGVNHDSDIWTAPDEFRPERFGSWDGDAFNFIPQGSGDHHLHHRCPGEWITIELMLAATDWLTRRLTYEVPAQDLTIDESRLPALPRSRFVMEHVRLIG
jgi:fatty-acid peroxygenase